MGLLVSVLVSYRSIKRVKAHDFYRIGAGRDEATTPRTTWSGSSVSSPGAATAAALSVRVLNRTYEFVPLYLPGLSSGKWNKITPNSTRLVMQ